MTLQKVKGVNYYRLPKTLDGYACIDGDILWLSAIFSKEPNKGNFRRFLDDVEKKFKVIKVPTPSNSMVKILTKRGYVLKKEYFEKFKEEGEVMVKNCEGLK